MQLSMKTYLALLWGISVLFSMKSMSASIPESSSVNSTVEPNKTTKQLNSSENGIHNETVKEPATWHPTHKSTEPSVAQKTTVSPTVETQEATVIYMDNLNDSTGGLVATTTVAAPTSSSGPRLIHTSTAANVAADETQPSHNTTISETAKPTEEQLHPQPPNTSTDMTSSPATTSAKISVAPLATETVSSSQPTSAAEPTSATKPEATSILSSTTSPANSTQAPVFVEKISSPSATTTSTVIVNPTSEAAPVSDHTSSPKINETSTTSTELPSTSQPISLTRTHISTSEFTGTAGSSSTTEPPTISFSTNTTAATVSTNATGILVPRGPKRSPIPTSKSTPTSTMAPRNVSKSPSSTEAQPCSTRGVVKHCLIALASLAGLATIFMVSTIVLCAKLSARKYKVKKPQQATEMMCISALLPERSYNYSRQRNPVTNGVLVIPSGGDSDEDGGDNLTLSSFLPENDRFV